MQKNKRSDSTGKKVVFFNLIWNKYLLIFISHKNWKTWKFLEFFFWQLKLLVRELGTNWILSQTLLRLNDKWRSGAEKKRFVPIEFWRKSVTKYEQNIPTTIYIHIKSVYRSLPYIRIIYTYYWNEQASERARAAWIRADVTKQPLWCISIQAAHTHMHSSHTHTHLHSERSADVDIIQQK